ncbi:MAG: glycine/sarcosine/betaine reductase complex component C subunit beta [Firmicutes bacterium]|nr:glycine/sarcosine/betaine reductase complex component C subunit beta [Bacillota bacterium]
MSFPVIKGASYSLFHTPEMTVHQGSNQTTERLTNPNSEHFKNLQKSLRSFDDFVKYPPNQVYIGNIKPDMLKCHKRPWYEHPMEVASTDGAFGAIYTEEELIALVKIVDVFDLVVLEESFQAATKVKLEKRQELQIIDKLLLKLDSKGVEFAELERMVNDDHAEGLYYSGRLVGCVKKAHAFDPVLTAHVMFENLVSKATAAVNLLQMFTKTKLRPRDIDYIIETSEEACGDMNQRGGGNMAKSIGEICGCINATGSDTRSFCAGPVHGLVQAAALVQSGIYKNVVVIAGGSTAKLGMNSKSHIDKNMPALEDCLGSFAIHVSENDGINPIIRTDVVGRHTIGAGSAPQAVITAIVTDPLDRAGLKLNDIDKFSPELQNPEITVPAGAGDVTLSNLKMIAALGVKRGDFLKEDMERIVNEKGMPGYAPTQGHIPSGIPYIGFARQDIMNKKLKKVMIIGKGSLFLGRLTNLFDGVSFVMEENTVPEETTTVSKEEVRSIVAEALKNLAQSL